MDYIFSHTYRNPDTGELVDVMVPDDDGDASEYRNAGARDHRSRSGSSRLTRSGSSRSRSTTRRSGGSGGNRVEIQRRGGGGIVDDGGGLTRYDGDYLAIRKSALADLIPTIGELWASFLGLPDAPQVVGDDVTDRTNAGLHREALARHQQSQARILAVTNLASRAIHLFAN
jgi:hypothetical protein